MTDAVYKNERLAKISNTIQYKTCNAPYVTGMLFVGAVDVHGLWNSHSNHNQKINTVTLTREWLLWRYRRRCSRQKQPTEGTWRSRRNEVSTRRQIRSTTLNWQHIHPLILFSLTVHLCMLGGRATPVYISIHQVALLGLISFQSAVIF